MIEPLTSERRPLDQVEVVVTRASHQNQELAKRLRLLGADVICAPTIQLKPPPPRDDEIYRQGTWLVPAFKVKEQLWRFDWVIFTSVNAVRYADDLFGDIGGLSGALRLQALGGQSSDRRAVKVVSVGSSTQRALNERGIVVTHMPRKYYAESLIERLSQEMISGQRVLIPRALKARELLPEALRARGAEVWISPMYQTVKATLTAEVKERLVASLGSARARALLFTSDSTVLHLLEQLSDKERSLVRGRCDAFAIGPIVQQTMSRRGLRVCGMASPHTIDGLVECLVRHYRAF